MRESRQYINFFRRNFLIILSSLIFALICGLFYKFHSPRVNVASQLYEINYSAINVNNQMLLTDEAVSSARESAKILGIEQVYEVRSYKNGPLSFFVNLKSLESKDKLYATFMKVNKYLTNKFEIKKIGQTHLWEEYENLYFIFFLSSMVGLMVGIILALIREYFHKY